MEAQELLLITDLVLSVIYACYILFVPSHNRTPIAMLAGITGPLGFGIYTFIYSEFDFFNSSLLLGWVVAWGFLMLSCNKVAGFLFKDFRGF